jgi:hypothetical protein
VGSGVISPISRTKKCRFLIVSRDATARIPNDHVPEIPYRRSVAGRKFLCVFRHIQPILKKIPVSFPASLALYAASIRFENHVAIRTGHDRADETAGRSRQLKVYLKQHVMNISNAAQGKSSVPAQS